MDINALTFYGFSIQGDYTVIKQTSVLGSPVCYWYEGKTVGRLRD